eukprot:3939380-Rhodomonas_salina.1
MGARRSFSSSVSMRLSPASQLSESILHPIAPSTTLPTACVVDAAPAITGPGSPATPWGSGLKNMDLLSQSDPMCV